MSEATLATELATEMVCWWDLTLALLLETSWESLGNGAGGSNPGNRKECGSTGIGQKYGVWWGTEGGREVIFFW